MFILWCLFSICLVDLFVYVCLFTSFYHIWWIKMNIGIAFWRRRSRRDSNGVACGGGDKCTHLQKRKCANFFSHYECANKLPHERNIDRYREPEQRFAKPRYFIYTVCCLREGYSIFWICKRQSFAAGVRSPLKQGSVDIRVPF